MLPGLAPSVQIINPLTLLNSPLTRASSSADASSYSFTARQFGVDVPGRTVIALLSHFAGDNGPISLVSIGGIAATILGQTINSGGPIPGVAIASPVGTTGTITFSGPSAFGAACAEMSILGDFSVIDVKSSQGSGARSATIQGVAGGLVVATVGSFTNGGSPSWTWMALTKRLDQSYSDGGNNIGFSYAYDFIIADGAISISATPTTGNSSALIAVSLGPK